MIFFRFGKLPTMSGIPSLEIRNKLLNLKPKLSHATTDMERYS